MNVIRKLRATRSGVVKLTCAAAATAMLGFAGAAAAHGNGPGRYPLEVNHYHYDARPSCPRYAPPPRYNVHHRRQGYGYQARYPAAPVYRNPPVYRGRHGGGYGGGNVLPNAVLGAAGGYLGSQIGGGSGRLAATAGGAVLGWTLGNNLGR